MKWDSPSKSKTQNKTFSTQCFFSGKTTEHDTEYWVGKKVGVIKSFSDKTWGIADIWYPAVLSGAPNPCPLVPWLPPCKITRAAMVKTEKKWPKKGTIDNWTVAITGVGDLAPLILYPPVLLVACLIPSPCCLLSSSWSRIIKSYFTALLCFLMKILPIDEF